MHSAVNDVTLVRSARCRFARVGTLALVGLLLGAGVVRAETVPLVELERRALQRRATLVAARSRSNAARAEVSLARAPYRPTVGASLHGEMSPGTRLVRMTDVDGDEYLVPGSRALGDAGVLTPDFRYGAQLSMDARLYDFGRTSASVRAAIAEQGASGLDERAAERSVVLEVRNAYLDWLTAHGTRDILRRNADDARKLREADESRASEGSQPGALTATARFDEVRASLDLERAEAALEVSRLALERASGAPLSATGEPDFSVLEPSPAPRDVNGSLEAAVLERRRDALVATAEARRAGRLPVLGADVDLGMRGQGATLFPLYRVGVSLTIPVLDGGIASASADQASSRAAELSSLAREVRADVSLRSRQALVVANRAEREIELAQLLVDVAEQALRHATDQRELEGGGSDAVVRARIQRSRAELEVLTARIVRARALMTMTENPTR
jgi:outer membrane protein